MLKKILNLLILTITAPWLAAGVALAATDENPKPVIVTNFPEAQDVAGTVSVDNFPASQTVNGAVSVSNLPSVQDVALIPPLLDSGRVNFNINVLGNYEEITVATGVVMTDVVINPFQNGDFTCGFTIFEGTPAAANILLQPVLADRQVFSLHFESGIEGLLTMRVTAGGLGTGSCAGTLFWTGYVP